MNPIALKLKKTLLLLSISQEAADLDASCDGMTVEARRLTDG